MIVVRQLLPTVLSLLVTLSGLGALGGVARAQGRDAGPTPPRLSFVDGDVSFWRPGAEDWAPAQVNTALAAGDAVYAGDAANLELQVAARAFVRAGADTEIDLDSLDPAYTQFRVTAGHAAFDFPRLPSGQTVEVDTPSAAFTIARSGYYRVDVDDNGTTFIVRRGGTATVIPAGGAETDVTENQQVVLQGTENVQAIVNAAPDLDPWDRWNNDRTAQRAETPRSAQYVPPDVAGVDDLDRHGDWRDEPRYGHVWVPHDVRPDWAPYSTGRWVYDPYYEWTWVDDAPWGWAPYHYGRWVPFGGAWGWAPGPVIAAPVYAPALVAFFGAPGIGVSVGIGLPFVSWCALGFGEPIIPWWGGSGFVGRPFWGGWGGPRIVNNVVINNTKIVNVNNITKYQNVTVNNAVVGVDRNQFGRGGGQHVRLTAAQAQRLQPVRGPLGVKPVAASLVPKQGPARRPPDSIRARPVVATRPPQDPSGRLRAAGLSVQGLHAPASKIVQPRRGAQAGPSAGGAARPPAVAPPPPGQHPGAVGRPGGPAGMAPRRPGAPGAPARTTPPPPPGAARARSGAGGRATPPPPPGAGRARPVRPGRPEAQAAPSAGGRRASGQSGTGGRATPPPPPGAARARPVPRPGRTQPERPAPRRERPASPPPSSRGGPGGPGTGQAPPPSARRSAPSPSSHEVRPTRAPRAAPPPKAERASRRPRATPRAPAGDQGHPPPEQQH